MKSIAVDDATHQDLVKLTKRHNLNIGEFVKHSVKYFRKTDINPAEPDSDSPKKAIAEMNKRLNQVIAYIKEHETSHIIPVMKKIERTNTLLYDLVKNLEVHVSEIPDPPKQAKQENVVKEAKQDDTEVLESNSEKVSKAFTLYKGLSPKIFVKIDQMTEFFYNSFSENPDTARKLIKDAESGLLKVYEDIFYDMIIHGKITESYGYKIFSEALKERINIRIVKSPEESFQFYKNRIINILIKK